MNNSQNIGYLANFIDVPRIYIEESEMYNIVLNLFRQEGPLKHYDDREKKINNEN